MFAVTRDECFVLTGKAGSEIFFNFKKYFEIFFSNLDTIAEKKARKHLLTPGGGGGVQSVNVLGPNAEDIVVEQC